MAADSRQVGLKQGSAHVFRGRRRCDLQEFVAIAGSEALRNNEPDSEKRKYPGGAFDPLGFAKDSKVPLFEPDHEPRGVPLFQPALIMFALKGRGLM